MLLNLSFSSENIFLMDFFLNFFSFFCRVVALESHLVRAGSLTQDDGHDLHILAGHEASY